MKIKFVFQVYYLIFKCNSTCNYMHVIDISQFPVPGKQAAMKPW